METKTTIWRNSWGQCHREDGPAIVTEDGGNLWYINGQLHRVDGPAVEYADGHKEWYINGKLHREDGPAIETLLGKEWWLRNLKYSLEDYVQTLPLSDSGKIFFYMKWK